LRRCDSSSPTRWPQGRQLAIAATVELPFERALVHLQYGAQLRRAGRRAATVDRLRDADTVFRRLGARPFRRNRGPRAGGLTRTRAEGPAPLTAQERAVARLVSTGRSKPGGRQRVSSAPRPWSVTSAMSTQSSACAHAPADRASVQRPSLRTSCHRRSRGFRGASTPGSAIASLLPVCCALR
jgi:hypothetical protein